MKLCYEDCWSDSFEIVRFGLFNVQGLYTSKSLALVFNNVQIHNVRGEGPYNSYPHQISLQHSYSTCYQAKQHLAIVPVVLWPAKEIPKSSLHGTKISTDYPNESETCSRAFPKDLVWQINKSALSVSLSRSLTSLARVQWMHGYAVPYSDLALNHLYVNHFYAYNSTSLTARALPQLGSYTLVKTRSSYHIYICDDWS